MVAVLLAALAVISSKLASSITGVTASSKLSCAARMESAIDCRWRETAMRSVTARSSALSRSVIAICALWISVFRLPISSRRRSIRSARLRVRSLISPDTTARRFSSSAVIKRGAEATSSLVSSASLSDSTVAGRLRETISVVVLPMVVKA